MKPNTTKSLTSDFGLPERAEQTVVKSIIRLDSIGSTNSHLASLLRDGACVGSAVIAREQTEGRGQLGRAWHSPKDLSLYISFSWRGSTADGLPATVSCAIAQALRAACRVSANVRWPNDVVIDGKKVAGILVESSGVPDVWIIGCGININNTSFPPDIAAIATSVLLESGDYTDIAEIEDAVIRCLDASLNRLERDGFAGMLHMWRQFDTTPGSLVRVRDDQRERLVQAVGVDDQGRLVARDGNHYAIIIGASAIEWVRTGLEPSVE